MFGAMIWAFGVEAALLAFLAFAILPFSKGRLDRRIPAIRLDGGDHVGRLRFAQRGKTYGPVYSSDTRQWPALFR